MKNDHLFIEEFELPCRVGITAEERAFPQLLTVCLWLELPLAKAGNSDSLHDTLDYAAIIEATRSACSVGEFQLVERVAEIIAAAALKNPLLEAVRVKVGKKVFAGIKSVGACIHRQK